MLGSILSFTESAGYPLLFALIMAESAGIPLPGETALIAAAALAGTGHLSIELVVLIAAAAAIIGDNLGFLVARRYGRGLLLRGGPFASRRRRALELGDAFFARHGAKAVFFGRWILGLRTWTAWLAGASHMRWRAFSLWNAAGGITWATTVGLTAYFIGQNTAGIFTIFGLVACSATLVVVGILLTRRQGTQESGSSKRARPHSDLDL
jgi:undecaprenyl-diphosphatase